MRAVVRQLAQAPQADIHAMAVYLADLMRASPGGRAQVAVVDQAEAAGRLYPQGAALYAGACAACHDAGAPMMLEGRPGLQLGTPLHEADPKDTLQILLKGLEPPVGAAFPYMPAFDASFTDAQLAEIAAYMRARYTDKPPWCGLAAAASEARKAATS